MAGETRATACGDFAADFVEDRLSNLCDPKSGVQTGPFGSQLHQEDYVTVGTPIITVEHLGENRIFHEDVPKVSDEDKERLSKYTLRKGDIVFSRVGSVDRRALVRDAEAGWLFSGRCLRVRPDLNKIDSGYLSYFFGLQSFKEHIRAIAVGATMPSLNTQLLSDVVVPHPQNLSEQRAIAHILGALDDKIELNRKMNETLEAMAQAIFKSWFVDFDPVRAKAEGRQPNGLDPEIAKLFPDSFQDSELGEIPRGWRVCAVGDVVHAFGGTTPSTNEPNFWNGSICFATPKDMASLTAPILLDTERQITEQGLAQISSGLLPRGTVLLSSRAPIGYLAMTEISVAVNQGFIAMICDLELPNYYILHWTKENMGTIIGNANGTTFLEISKKNFRPIKILVPIREVLKCFVEQVEQLYHRIVANLHETRTLAAIRDALLPKLLSGEIRVKDAEKFLEKRQ
jgi:type I restriction enzyme S subunit